MNMVLIRIALSFVIAGAWIASVTYFGERLGSRKAGLLGNMPSNILISLLFMGITKGPEYAAASTAGVPMGMMIDTIFLAVFVFVIPYGLRIALPASFAAWALAAILVLAVLPPLNFLASIAVYIVVTVALFFLVSAKLGARRVEKKPVKFSWKVSLVRAFFAGSVVAGAVAIAQVAPPYMTGVLATFPAVMTSTMVILTMSQGPDFAQATGKILILSSCNIIVFSTCAGLFFVALGPWLGTLLAYAASICSILLIDRLTIRVR